MLSAEVVIGTLRVNKKWCKVEIHVSYSLNYICTSSELGRVARSVGV